MCIGNSWRQNLITVVDDLRRISEALKPSFRHGALKVVAFKAKGLHQYKAGVRLLVICQSRNYSRSEGTRARAMHTKVESSSGRLPVKLLKAQVEFPHTFHDDKFRIQRVCQPINVEDKAV